MNGESFEDFAGRKGRSLSFSHTRFHRHNSSSEEDDSPSRNDEYDDEFSRDSLSEFSNVTLNDQEGRGHKREPQDDLSTVTRKRTFSSSDPHSTDGDANANGKSEKRTATKICRVCGDKAYSYNFSVVTCESCKAFFRRNANKDKDIRCPFNDNCDINIVSRRFCQKCRLAKCFKVGMKKEWIMTDEARQEKKKRIQDNRERRMAERAQEEAMLQHKQMAIPPQTNGASLDSASTQIITNSIQLNPPPEAAIVQPQLAQNMPPLGTLNPGILPALPQASAITTIIPSEPQTVMQQVIQQAQQVQNAQLLAQVAAMQNQTDPIASIQMASIGSTGVPTQPTNVVAAANLSHLAQVIQSQTDTMASIGTTSIPVPSENAAVDSYQSACLATNVVAAANLNANLNHLAQVAAMQNQTDPIVSIQSPTTTAAMVNLNNLAQAAAQIQQNLANQQIQQQINANLAAQRIEASQNLADQQQLVAAVAVAAISNQNPILPSIIPSPQNSTPLASVPLAPLVEPVIQPVLPQAVNPNNEMIAVRKDVLMNIVQENIENRHQQLQQQINTPPVKCKCICQCGRYSSESVIVDHVMADMLQGANNSISPPVLNQQPIIESMDCSRHDIDCCLLTEDDKMALGELEQADKIFWAADPTSFDTSASDAALRKVIRMVTSLNSFNKLSRADQSNLLRHGCPSHFVIRQAMGNLNENQQSLMVVQFHNSLREEWRNNHQLMLLLSIMVIFDPDTPNIENKIQVEQTCSRLKSILKRMLYSFYMDSQKTINEFDDLIAKLNVLQSLNNAPIQQTQNGADSHRFWSSEILEPLLSRELFEPNLMISNNVVNTISSMT